MNLHWFDDLAQARVLVEAYRCDYNESRPHTALNNLPSAKDAIRSGSGRPITGFSAAQN